MDKIKRHTPIIDLDNDLHSPVQAIRGSLWRGKDCNDYDTRVYPGRRQSNLGAAVDHNCNGIVGADKNNVPYEELYCRAGFNRGVLSIGDSGSAHFRIPEQLFDPAYMNFESYKHILRIAETEADWPHLSWGTGYFEQDDTGLTPGPVDSIYKRMRDHNRCTHRDYQNIAVNGASSNNVLPYIQQLSRNQTADEPLLVMYALIGNDVCGETPGLDRQTKPAEFYANVKKTLDYLETRLPPNSFGKCMIIAY
jgi:acyloxyacyl hydrolase